MAVLQSEKEATVDWSELCPDLLQLAAKKLPELSDFVRLRAVCRRWRSSAPVSEPPPLLPWLLFVPIACSKIEDDANLHFFSLSSKKFFTMPGAPSSAFHSSTHQYVVMWHKESRTLQSLFNPLTNNEVSLPHIKLGWTSGIRVHGDSIMIYQGTSSEILTWQLGDTNWYSRHVDVHDALPILSYCNGTVFHLDKSKLSTKVFNADASRSVVEIPPPLHKIDYNFADYLIESSGELLGVWRLTSVWLDKHSFVVYKLQNSGNNDFNWVKMSNIGDRILLLNKFGRTGLSVSGKDYGLKGSCIYFHGFRHVNGQRFTVFSRYDIRDGSVEELARLLEPQNCMWSWFVPSLQ